jgi:nucleotide-binding universal stress UspA family protein
MRVASDGAVVVGIDGSDSAVRAAIWGAAEAALLRLTRGRPVPTLLEFGERAQLIVVGSRGLGGFKGVLLGSTSQVLVAHSPCRLAVGRSQVERDG